MDLRVNRHTNEIRKWIAACMSVLFMLSMVVLSPLHAQMEAQATAPSLYNADGYGFSGTLNNPIEITNPVWTGCNNWPSGVDHGYFGGVFDGTNIWMVPAAAGPTGLFLVKMNTTTGKMTKYNGWPAGFDTNNAKFRGGVFDGTSVWLIPHVAGTHIIQVNITTGEMTGYNNWPTQQVWGNPYDTYGLQLGQSTFSGGVFDGTNIWLVPYSSNYALIKFNTVTGQMTTYGYMGLPGYSGNSAAFSGGVFDGTNIWLIPASESGVLKVNATTGAMTLYNSFPAGFTGSSFKFHGGVYDGTNIWLIPYRGSHLVKMNASTGAMSLITWPTGFSKSLDAFWGGVSDGANIWLIPYQSSHVVKVNMATGAMTAYDNWPAGFTKTTTTRFISGVYDGKDLWMIPQSPYTSVVTSASGVTCKAPTDISLGGSTVAENRPIGTTVGTLTATDADTATFSLVSGFGDTDNASFTIAGSSLKTAASFDYETKSTYNIRISVENSIGATYEKEFTVNVTDVIEQPDTQAPSAPTLLTSSNVTTSSLDLSWNASSDNTAVTAYLIYQNGNLIATVTSGTNYSVSGLTPDTSYTFQIKAKDLADNTSSASNPLVQKTLSSSPTTPSGMKAKAVTNQSLTITWEPSTDDVAVTGYKVYMDGKLIATVGAGTTSYDFSGLTAGKEYMFEIVAFDEAGYHSPKGLYYASTESPKLQDTLAPSVPTGLKSSAMTATGFIVSWASAKDNIGGSGLNHYKIYVNGNASAIEVPADETSYPFTDLNPNLSYTIEILAEDHIGNKSAKSAPLTITTKTDLMAPKAPLIDSHSKLTKSSMRIHWTKATDNVDVTGYEVFQNGVSIGTSANLYFDISGLTADTTYLMTVRASDAATNKSSFSNKYSVKTLLENDKQVPTTPANVIAFETKATEYSVAWDVASDNHKISYYEVYKNGVLVGTTNEPLYTFTGLNSGESYDVNIIAVDLSGSGPEGGPNKSAMSTTISVTTSIDSTPPTTPNSLVASNVKGNEVTLTWEAANDDVEVDHYEIYKDGILIEDDVTTTTSVISGLDPESSVRFSVKAVDAAGNASDESDPLTLMTTNCEEDCPDLQSDDDLADSRFADKRTVVKFSVDAEAYMTLNIFDANGKVVQKGPQNTRITAGGRKMPLNVRKLKEGNYQIIVSAVDESGKKTTLYRDLTIDHTSPVISKLTKTNIIELPTSTEENGKTSAIGFTLSEDAFVTVKIYNSNKVLVRTLVSKKSYSKGINSVEWNGYDKFNKALPDGVYSVLISGYDVVRLEARLAKTNVTINRNAPIISGVELTPAPFKASAKTKLTMKYSLDEASKVTIDIYQSDGTTLVKTVIKDASKGAGNFNASWNGKNNLNAIVTAGTYVYSIKAVDSVGKQSMVTGTFTVTN
jgi:chitodextrinase/flagellar hook assembly protein FlgD